MYELGKQVGAQETNILPFAHKQGQARADLPVPANVQDTLGAGSAAATAMESVGPEWLLLLVVQLVWAKAQGRLSLPL